MKYQIVELYPSRLLSLVHRKTRSKIKCTPLRDLSDANPNLWHILKNESGKAIVTVPWMPHQIMEVDNPDDSKDKLLNVITVDMIASNRERRCFAFQKRSCWKSKYADKLKNGDFEHKLNGTFCEYTVNGKFCLRLMRVIRKPNFRASRIIRTLFKFTKQNPVKLSTAPTCRGWIKHHIIEKLKPKKGNDSENDIVELIENDNWAAVCEICIRQPETLIVMDVCILI